MPGRALRSIKLRNALYASTDGRCALCGCTLPDNWHADHIVPWSLTHRTNVHGMQPLCPSCNLRKGSTMPFTLRPFQQAMQTEAIRLASLGHRLLVANVHAGSGKTPGYLLAGNALWRAGVIEQLAIFTPRLNLAMQAETDWDRLRGRVGEPTFGRVVQRDNELPFLRKDETGALAFGYATTYQSLLANPKLHLDFARAAPTLVVFDEGQQLGADDESGGQGTKSAALGEQLAALAEFTFLLSGTPYRADGRPLILATYDEPDARGFRALQAHVEADYLTGVDEGYLREFEAVLHDGRGVWQYLGEEPETLTLSEIDRRLSHVLRQPGYWEPLVDRFVAKLRDVRGDIHPELTGLIAALDQAQAKEMIGYLRRTAPDLPVLLAVSDELAARDNLRRFRKGQGVILVTVAMAHVGFDCPTISVILPLTAARSEAWLRQLFARGLRVWYGPDKQGDPAPDPDCQVCFVVAPDDKLMAAMVAKLRRESRAGVEAREERTGGGGGGGGQTKFGLGLGAEILDDRVIGINPDGDADHQFVSRVRHLAAKHGIPRSMPESKLAAMMREAWGAAPTATSAPERGPVVMDRPPVQQDERGEKEREKALRRECNKLAAGCDRFMKDYDATWAFGHTHAEAKRWFGTGLGACGMGDLPTRLEWYRSFYNERRAHFEGRR